MLDNSGWGKVVLRDNAMVLKWIILMLLDIDFLANNVLSKTENVIQLSH